MPPPRRWRQRPPGSNWGDFGADDQIGRLNLLTPRQVRQGLAEAREGISFCLSLPLDYPGGNVLNPRRHGPILRPTVRSGKPNMIYRVAEEVPGATDVINDDVAIIHLQYSTQWDGLAHFGALFDADGDGVPEPVFYNGYRPGEHILFPTDVADAGAVGTVDARSTSHAHVLDVAKMAEKCVQGRGVMIDLHAHFGRQGIAVGYDRLMAVLESDGIEVEPGDFVCLHTGFAQLLLEMKKSPDPRVLGQACASLDGRDTKLLNWVTGSGVVALVADNYAVEKLPALEQPHGSASLPLHEHCIFKLGVYLGELWYLSELARWLRANGRKRFLLTAPPLRLPGAVGSPVTPVATV